MFSVYGVGLGLRVEDLGLRILRFCVQGYGVRVRGSGFMVESTRLRVWASRFGV